MRIAIRKNQVYIDGFYVGKIIKTDRGWQVNDDGPIRQSRIGAMIAFGKRIENLGVTHICQV